MGSQQPLELPRSRWTLVEAARLQAQRLADREFLAFEGGETLTFAELHHESDRLATALAGLGVEPGDRVLALAGNSRAFLLAMLATHKRRAVFTPVNTELKGAFLEHQVRNSAPRVVIVEEELLALFEHVDTSGAGIGHTVVIGPRPAALPGALAATTLLTWDELAASAPAAGGAGGALVGVVEPEPADVCTIMYTSGTTGPSKGVLMPQAHCFLFAAGAARATSLGEGDRYYVCMPFFHANALLMQVFACLVAGAPATVVRRFSASSWLDDVIESGATASNALGVMPEFLFRQPASARDRAHRLTRVMAVPIAEEWGAAFEARFGVRLIQGYGMTEVNMVAYSDPADPVLAGCAGRVEDEFFEVVVADPETDEPLPAGGVGEILVRPRQPNCFNVGYFGMADKTVEAWRNLWFHTGDAGRLDAEGRLWFVDRLRDRIRRRGENVSSYEIEQVLNDHAAVLESAAVGVRVEGAGGEEEIKACVVLAGSGADGTGPAGAGFEPADLLDWCQQRMPRYAVPRYVEVVAALDKTPSGKVRKQALRDAGVASSTWDREAAGYQLRR
ncbi:MAG: AMP-binding protein [Acidimicrobiia bacterium]|nr:AMP-binding protein [Acidimicrobiia bacterium]